MRLLGISCRALCCASWRDADAVLQSCLCPSCAAASCPAQGLVTSSLTGYRLLFRDA